MSDTMKVVLTGQMTGSRNGAPWPPVGTTVTLPQDEAYTLVNTGMARPLDSRQDAVELRAKAAEVAGGAVDDVTKAQVAAATTTRARASRSKRAHEPANLGSADVNQPSELDNGPQLPEVNAEDSARVEDPAEDTSSLDGVTGDTKPVEQEASGEAIDLAAQTQPKGNSARANKAQDAK